MMESNLILASASDRRQELLRRLGIDYRVVVSSIDESSYPPLIPVEKLALYLAQKKGQEISHKFPMQVVLAADTIVLCDGKILRKPTGKEEAFKMLTLLSDKWHQVITGVAIFHPNGQESHTSLAEVRFKALSHREIEQYIGLSPPLDKAGAYGIQEWIGLIGVKEIRGSFYSIMGLPTDWIYETLCKLGIT